MTDEHPLRAKLKQPRHRSEVDQGGRFNLLSLLGDEHELPACIQKENKRDKIK